MPTKRYALSTLWQKQSLPNTPCTLAVSSSPYAVCHLAQKRAEAQGLSLQKIHSGDRTSLLEQQGQVKTLFGETPCYLLLDAENIPMRDWSPFLTQFFSPPLAHPRLILFYRALSYGEKKRAESILEKSRTMSVPIAFVEGELTKDQLVQILKAEAQALKLTLSQSALNLLLAKTVDPDFLLKELEKLSLAFEGEAVLEEHVEAVAATSSQAAAPSLFFAILKRDGEKVEQIVDTLAAFGENPVSLLALLYTLGQKQITPGSPFAVKFFQELFSLDALLKGWHWPQEFSYEDLKRACLKLANA